MQCSVCVCSSSRSLWQPHSVWDSGYRLAAAAYFPQRDAEANPAEHTGRVLPERVRCTSWYLLTLKLKGQVTFLPPAPVCTSTLSSEHSKAFNMGAWYCTVIEHASICHFCIKLKTCSWLNKHAWGPVCKVLLNALSSLLFLCVCVVLCLTE